MIRRRSILALVVLATAACNSLDNSTPRGNYAIVFADAIPRTSAGKFQKNALRERYAGWTWPPATSSG